MENGENDHNEQRRRQRQVAGQLILLVGVRPIAEEGDEVQDAEQHRLGGEQIGEEGEKGRLLPSRQRSERGQPRGDADQERHLVLFKASDDEGENREGGKAQHAHRARDLGGRKKEKAP